MGTTTFWWGEIANELIRAGHSGVQGEFLEGKHRERRIFRQERRRGSSKMSGASVTKLKLNEELENRGGWRGNTNCFRKGGHLTGKKNDL